MTRATGRASGKAILAGEHFVVYGAPAVAVPLPAVSLEVELSAPAAAPVPTGHVGECLRLVRERWGGPPPGGVAVEVRSDIPIGAGLGSSAALSVAMARAWAALLGREAGASELRAVSLDCERLAHGEPSGIDTEVAITGRAVRFVRGEVPRPLAVAPGIGLVVLDTGTAASTRTMVDAVARRRTAEPAAFACLVESAAKRVAEAEAALGAGDFRALGAALDAVQSLLEAAGVSTPELERAVRAAREAGAAGAKLTGKGGGGAVLGVCAADRAEPLAERLRTQGWKVVAAGAIASAR